MPVAAAGAAEIVVVAGILVHDARVVAIVLIASAEIPGTPRCPLDRILAPSPTPFRTPGIGSWSAPCISCLRPFGLTCSGKRSQLSQSQHTFFPPF